MKTFFTTIILIFSTLAAAQKKDLTKQQILKHPAVLEFAKSKNTTPNEVFNFLKCAKKESKLKSFRSLPLFTSKLPIITPKNLEDHNFELWEDILYSCQDKEIESKKLNNDEKIIYDQITKSYYHSIFPNLNYSFIAITYNCINKNYKYDIFNEKEFLNKNDFFKKYPDYDKRGDNAIEQRSLFQESKQKMHFSSINKKQNNFPKCFKYSDFFID